MVLIIIEKKSFKSFAISLSWVINFSIQPMSFFDYWLIYLKALVSRFSRTFDCLWNLFRIRSKSNSSYLTEIRIIFFVLCNFVDLLNFYFLSIYFKDLFLRYFRFISHNLFTERFIHKWSVHAPLCTFSQGG